jgi:hypothetical protein
LPAGPTTVTARLHQLVERILENGREPRGQPHEGDGR